jgi:hypothetical protein
MKHGKSSVVSSRTIKIQKERKSEEYLDVMENNSVIEQTKIDFK